MRFHRTECRSLAWSGGFVAVCAIATIAFHGERASRSADTPVTIMPERLDENRVRPTSERPQAQEAVPMATEAPGGRGGSGPSRSCPSGQMDCHGTCVDPLTDVNHCGSCDVCCPSFSDCDQGHCDCPYGSVLCRGPTCLACALVNTDPMNCGACGRRCLRGARCEAGTCSCPQGQTACGGRCVARGRGDDSGCDHEEHPEERDHESHE